MRFCPFKKRHEPFPLFSSGVSDPLGQGIVQSLSRPTGNATGFSNLEFSLIGKWLQVLKEAAPTIKRVGLMISTSNASSPSWYRMFNEVAPTLPLSRSPFRFPMLLGLKAQ